jgi:hypothetical protein
VNMLLVVQGDQHIHVEQRAQRHRFSSRHRRAIG